MKTTLFPSRKARPAACSLLAACLALTACGGGGGGGSEASGPKPLGLVKMIVKDGFGTPVQGVAVQSSQGKISTDAQGVALVPLASPDSTETVSLSRDTFVDTSVKVSSSPGGVNEAAVTLERATSPAGGSMSARGGSGITIDPSGQQMGFDIELVVVDGQSRPITTLTAGDFALQACTPQSATDRNDCIGGPGGTADVAYAPNSAQPETLAAIPGAAPLPYASALLLDQSGSIATTDPTGARIYSTKAFLKSLGGSDQALLAAFAGAPGALIATPPLTVYAPFRDRSTASSAYFPTLDALAGQTGGNTPLYDAVDSLRQQMAAPAGLAKAIVIFTDGADTSCSGVDGCRLARQRAIDGARQDGTRLVTIGLSSAVDTAALGDLANRTGGVFLYADKAQQLLPLYGSVGSLVGQSLPTYRLRWTVTAATVGVFHSGISLLGKVQVKAGSSSFDVPFVVAIP